MSRRTPKISCQQDKKGQSDSGFVGNEPIGRGSASTTGPSGTGANAPVGSSDKVSLVHLPSDTQGVHLGEVKLGQILNTTLDLTYKSEETLSPGPKKALDTMRQRQVPYNKSTLRQRQIARDMEVAEETTEPCKVQEGTKASTSVTEIEASKPRKNMTSETINEAAPSPLMKSPQCLETKDKETNKEVEGNQTVTEKEKVKKKNRRKKRSKGKGVDREPKRDEIEQAARVSGATPPKEHMPNESSTIAPREITTREGRIILIHQAVLPIRNREDVQGQKPPEEDPAVQHKPKQKELQENQLDQDEQTPIEQVSSHISSSHKAVTDTEEKFDPETLQPPSFLGLKGKKKAVSVTLPWSPTIQPGDFKAHTKITQLMRDAMLHEEYLHGVIAEAEWLDNMCAEELAHFGKLYLDYDSLKHKLKSLKIEKQEEGRMENKNSALSPPFFQEQDQDPWAYKRMYSDEYVRLQLKGQASDSFSLVSLGKRKRPPTEGHEVISRASRRRTLTYTTRDEWSELSRMSEGFLNMLHGKELGHTTEQVDKGCQTSPEQISYVDIHSENSEDETDHLCEVCLQEAAACSALKNARGHSTEQPITRRPSATTRVDKRDRKILGISKECIIDANIELDEIRSMIKNFRVSSTSENPVATAYAELDVIKQKIAKVERLTTPSAQQTPGEADSSAGPSGASQMRAPGADGTAMKQFHKILDDTLRNILIVEKLLDLGITQPKVTLSPIPELDEGLISTIDSNAEESEEKKEVGDGGIRKRSPKQKLRS